MGQQRQGHKQGLPLLSQAQITIVYHVGFSIKGDSEGGGAGEDDGDGAGEDETHTSQNQKTHVLKM